MTDTETNRALSEALGYRVQRSRQSGSWHLYRPDGTKTNGQAYERAGAWTMIPDFCGDWAAMGELWAWLIKQGWTIQIYDRLSWGVRVELLHKEWASFAVDWVADVPPLALARAAYAWLQTREEK